MKYKTLQNNAKIATSPEPTPENVVKDIIYDVVYPPSPGYGCRI